MLALKTIKWLLAVAVAGPLLTVIATCIVLLLLVLVLLPGGLEILLLGWAQAKRWLVKLLPFGKRRGALAATTDL